MVKGSTEQEELMVLNVYGPNTGTPRYIRQVLKDLQRDLDFQTIIVGDFSTPLSIGHAAQSNLQTQCYHHQATIDFLHRTGKNHHELHMEPKESPHSQVNSKQKEHSGRHHTT